MIKAYHRVSSNDALHAIMDAGQIVPAAYRLDPARIWNLCQEDVGRTFDMTSRERLWKPHRSDDFQDREGYRAVESMSWKIVKP